MSAQLNGSLKHLISESLKLTMLLALSRFQDNLQFLRDNLADSLREQNDAACLRNVSQTQSAGRSENFKRWAQQASDRIVQYE